MAGRRAFRRQPCNIPSFYATCLRQRHRRLLIISAFSFPQGMRFEITKPLNQNFFLSHSLFMGNMELGTGGRQVCG